MKETLLCAAILLLFVAGASAQPIEWTAAEGGNGHLYRWVTAVTDWHTARDLAGGSTYNGLQGHLVTINSQAENDWLCGHSPTSGLLWFGAFQAPGSNEPDGGWYWITGEPWDYADWLPNEPNNNGDENAGEFNEAGCGWNDLNAYDTEASAFIIEYEDGSVPASPVSFSFIRARY